MFVESIICRNLSKNSFLSLNTNESSVTPLWPDFLLNLHFATSNPNKISELSELLEYRLTPLELDLQEIQTTDLQELVKHKLKQAYEHIHTPVIVEDTSLYFKAWNELPGPLVKWFIENLGLAGLVSALSQFKDKSAQAVCCLGYTNNGKSMYLFEGKVKGVIVKPRGSLNFGWDPIFQPSGLKQTFGEMTQQDKHNISPRGKAATKFKHFLTQSAKQT